MAGCYEAQHEGSSTKGLVRTLMVSSRLAKQLGVDPNVILATSHGRRSIDTLRVYDPQLANWECMAFKHNMLSER